MTDLEVFIAVRILREATRQREITTKDEARLFLRDNGIEDDDAEVKLDHIEAFDGEAWMWTVTIGVTVPEKIQFGWAVVSE